MRFQALFVLGLCGHIGNVCAFRECVAISQAVDDMYCEVNCNQYPPNCPGSLCACEVPEDDVTPLLPVQQWPNFNFSFPECQAISEVASNVWCTATCAAGVCPRALCECASNETLIEGIIRDEPCANVVVVNETGCKPDAPHFDPEGMVCAYDGLANQSYCSYRIGPGVCAYCNESYNNALDLHEANPHRLVECTAVNRLATDEWCVATCSSGVCPASLCACFSYGDVVPESQPGHCFAKNLLATDQWCEDACLNNDPLVPLTCPDELCECPEVGVVHVATEVQEYMHDYPCCKNRFSRAFYISEGDVYTVEYDGQSGSPTSEPRLCAEFVGAFDIELEHIPGQFGNGSAYWTNTSNISYGDPVGFFVSDYVASTISYVHPNCSGTTLITSFASHLVGPAQSIAVYEGALLAALHDRVVAISLNEDYTFHSLETVFYSTGNVVNLEIDEDTGIIYIINGNEIGTIQPNGKKNGHPQYATFLRPSFDQPITDIADMVISEGVLYFTVPDNNQIWACPDIMLADGSGGDSSTCGQFCVHGGIDSVTCEGMHNPWGIACDCAGQLLVTNKASGTMVYIEHYNGQPLPATDLLKNLDHPADVEITSRGHEVSDYLCVSLSPTPTVSPSVSPTPTPSEAKKFSYATKFKEATGSCIAFSELNPLCDDLLNPAVFQQPWCDTRLTSTNYCDSLSDDVYCSQVENPSNPTSECFGGETLPDGATTSYCNTGCTQYRNANIENRIDAYDSNIKFVAGYLEITHGSFPGTDAIMNDYQKSNYMDPIPYYCHVCEAEVCPTVRFSLNFTSQFVQYCPAQEYVNLCDVNGGHSSCGECVNLVDVVTYSCDSHSLTAPGSSSSCWPLCDLCDVRESLMRSIAKQLWNDDSAVKVNRVAITAVAGDGIPDPVYANSRYTGMVLDSTAIVTFEVIGEMRSSRNDITSSVVEQRVSTETTVNATGASAPLDVFDYVSGWNSTDPYPVLNKCQNLPKREYFMPGEDIPPDDRNGICDFYSDDQLEGVQAVNPEVTGRARKCVANVMASRLLGDYPAQNGFDAMVGGVVSFPEFFFPTETMADDARLVIDWTMTEAYPQSSTNFNFNETLNFLKGKDAMVAAIDCCSIVAAGQGGQDYYVGWPAGDVSMPGVYSEQGARVCWEDHLLGQDFLMGENNVTYNYVIEQPYLPQPPGVRCADYNPRLTVGQECPLLYQQGSGIPAVCLSDDQDGQCGFRTFPYQDTAIRDFQEFMDMHTSKFCHGDNPWDAEQRRQSDTGDFNPSPWVSKTQSNGQRLVLTADNMPRKKLTCVCNS